MKINKVNYIMSLSDSEFVSEMYRLLFNREADSGGFQYYLGRLKKGYSKESVVEQMVKSAEFRGAVDSIPGLAQIITSRRSMLGYGKRMLRRIMPGFSRRKRSVFDDEIANLNRRISEIKDELGNSLGEKIDYSLNRAVVGLKESISNRLTCQPDLPEALVRVEKKEIDIWDQLLSISMEKKSIWFGLSAPIKVDFFDFGMRDNFRASSDMHGKYDVVWLYEVPVFNFGYWKLLVDEAIRLLKGNGYLIVRAADNSDGTIWELKSMLGRMFTIECDLVLQKRLADGSVVMVFSISRKYAYAYCDKRWTIAVLTDGRRGDNVISLVNRIEKIRGDIVVEYIVAGPRIPLLDHLGVVYVNHHYDDDLPRISEKKRLILSGARYSNVAIFHDRYIIDDNFFKGFDEFGYDFEFVTVHQEYENGELFPAYAGLPERKMRWQRPMYDANFKTLFDGHFVNGGLMIFKRHVTDHVNFNGMLLHNEAEDVELTYIMQDFGIVPRINLFSKAITVGVTPRHTETFIKV